MLAEQQHEEGEESLPAIVAELAVAVRALSASSGAALGDNGLPRQRGSLAGVLARRKKESDGRRRGLEGELRVLEGMADGKAVSDCLSRVEKGES